MVENGEIGIIGAMYNVTSGTVEFYEDTLVNNHVTLSKEMQAL
jgi:carbonic anhydrase